MTLSVFQGEREPRRICTRRRDHAPLDMGSRSTEPGRYSAYIWDHEEQEWEPYASDVSLMGLRATIRQLESEGWSPCSYLIERDR